MRDRRHAKLQQIVFGSSTRLSGKKERILTLMLPQHMRYFLFQVLAQSDEFHSSGDTEVMNMDGASHYDHLCPYTCYASEKEQAGSAYMLDTKQPVH